MIANYLDLPEEEKKQQVMDYLSHKLPPELKERYAKRRQEALDLQEANYKSPEDFTALKDSAKLRNLAAGLQKAANQFGTNPADGKVSSSYNIDDYMDSQNRLDAAEFDYSTKQYNSALAQEEKADQNLRDFDAYNLGLEEKQRNYETQQKNNAWTEEQQDQQRKDWEYDSSPVNDYTKTLAEQTLEKMGMGGKIPWDKITNRDLNNNPFLKQVIAKATAVQSSKPVYKNLRDGDGRVRMYALYPDGTKELMGDTGFAPSVRIDPVTGNLISVDSGGAKPISSQSSKPSSQSSKPSSPKVIDTSLRPGETVNDRDARVKIETATAIEGLKDEKVVAGAQFDADKAQATKARLLSLYKQAAKDDEAGGYLATANHNLKRVTKQPQSQAALDLSIELGHNMVNYIKDVSGATVTEQEVARLMKLLPDISDTEQVFNSKMEVFFRGVEESAGRERAKAGQPAPTKTTPTPPTNPGQPAKRKVYTPGAK
jgi:hypothetical protein